MYIYMCTYAHIHIMYVYTYTRADGERSSARGCKWRSRPRLSCHYPYFRAPRRHPPPPPLPPSSFRPLLLHLPATSRLRRRDCRLLPASRRLSPPSRRVRRAAAWLCGTDARDLTPIVSWLFARMPAGQGEGARGGTVGWATARRVNTAAPRPR